MSLIAITFKTALIEWFPFTTTRASDDTKLLPLIDLADYGTSRFPGESSLCSYTIYNNQYLKKFDVIIDHFKLVGLVTSLL